MAMTDTSYILGFLALVGMALFLVGYRNDEDKILSKAADYVINHNLLWGYIACCFIVIYLPFTIPYSLYIIIKNNTK
jgi:hypothetical protein